MEMNESLFKTINVIAESVFEESEQETAADAKKLGRSIEQEAKQMRQLMQILLLSQTFDLLQTTLLELVLLQILVQLSLIAMVWILFLQTLRIQIIPQKNNCDSLQLAAYTILVLQTPQLKDTTMLLSLQMILSATLIQQREQTSPLIRLDQQ